MSTAVKAVSSGTLNISGAIMPIELHGHRTQPIPVFTAFIRERIANERTSFFEGIAVFLISTGYRMPFSSIKIAISILSFYQYHENLLR
jgi:hypothetical protein